MKTEKLKLSELRSYSRGYSVIVRAVSKGLPRKSRETELVQQIVLLEDDQGDQMRAVLLGESVERLEKKMLLYEWYEVVDAPVIASDTPWKSGPKELNFQMHLSSDVEIRCLSGPPKMKFICYQTISNIKKRGLGVVGVDVLGVVLYIADKTETITTSDGRVATTREIALTDLSCDAPLFITMLDQLAADGCPAITLSAPDFLVISFSDMMTSAYKGFSLTTSATTGVSQHPLGTIPDRLRKWAVEDRGLLVERRNRLLTYLGLPIVRSVETIRNLENKTVYNTRRGDCYWLMVVFRDVYSQPINAYVGCSNCEGPTTTLLGTIYRCTFCLQQLCRARPCLNFHATIMDETGKMTLMLMTAQTELLFGVTAAELYEPKIQDKTLTLHGLATYLENVPRYVRVFAEFLESQHPRVMWRLIEMKTTDSSDSLGSTGTLNRVSELGRTSRSNPGIPNAIVEAVAGRSNVEDAYIEKKPPFTFI